MKAYNRKRCKLIGAGKAKPSFLISHELPLDKAVEGDDRNVASCARRGTIEVASNTLYFRRLQNLV